jgi:hypothetical protein
MLHWCNIANTLFLSGVSRECILTVWLHVGAACSIQLEVGDPPACQAYMIDVTAVLLDVALLVRTAIETPVCHCHRPLIQLRSSFS